MWGLNLLVCEALSYLGTRPCRCSTRLRAAHAKRPVFKALLRPIKALSLYLLKALSLYLIKALSLYLPVVLLILRPEMRPVFFEKRLHQLSDELPVP